MRSGRVMAWLAAGLAVLALAAAPAEEATNATNVGAAGEPEGEEAWSLFRYFRMGGPVMWVLLLCSILAGAFIIDRFVAFGRSQLRTEGFRVELLRTVRERGFGAAADLCRQTDTPFARTIRAGIGGVRVTTDRLEKNIETAASAEAGRLEKGLNILAGVGTVAPLLGFLGTVSGMIIAFKEIAEADQVSARLVATGIHQALITTATGLIIAIPAFFFHGYFISRVERFMADVESTTVELVREMEGGSAVEASPENQES